MRLLLLLTLLATLSSPAAQAGRVALVGAMNSSEPKEPGMNYTPATSVGAGLLMEFKFSPWFGFEFGALFLPRKYSFSTAVPASTTVTRRSKMYEFPAMLRWHMGQSLSLGVGGYYAQATEQISEETVADTGASYRTLTYGDAKQSTSDFGLVASICLYFRIAPLLHLVIDGRYTMGSKNNHTGSGSRKFNDTQLLSGLQFGF